MKNKDKRYITTEDIIIKKGTEINDCRGDGRFQMVIGYGNDFAQIVDITDMKGLFEEKLLKEIL
jgi:hypothetical protein